MAEVEGLAVEVEVLLAGSEQPVACTLGHTWVGMSDHRIPWALVEAEEEEMPVEVVP